MKSICSTPLFFAIAAVSALRSVAGADALDPPTTYYNTATGTGNTLKSQLYTTISTGFVGRNYGDARYSFAITDKDPAAAGKIVLAYNRASVSGTWDSGVTFNREHTWPRSLLMTASISNTFIGPASDAFELRPTNPTVNSNRGNLPYGTLNAASLPAFGTVASNNGTGTYYFPSNADKGDAARTIFYMATRYGQGQTNNLSLVNGQPGIYQMGDLASLLRWHYQDEVDTFERTRNQTIYSQALNPQYYQGNRNPYIDRPEFVWAVFGTGANNSQLSVAAPASDGSSISTVNLGRVMVGSTLGTQDITLNKTGTTPTTFNVAVSGNATSTLNGPRKAFDYNAQSRTTTVGLAGSTATAGVLSGTVSFDNTDLTSASAGTGSADANDVINVSATVLDPSNASFSSLAASKSLTVDFGIYAAGLNRSTIGFAVHNLASQAGPALTASLDLDSETNVGDLAAFSANPSATATPILAGTGMNFSADFTAAAIGQYQLVRTIANSDENIPGAQTRTALTLTLTGRVALGGDATLNGIVDFDDLLILAQNYANPSATNWSLGDFTRDTLTDFDDLLLLAQNYTGGNLTAGLVGGSLGAGHAFMNDWAIARSMVPEPASIFATLAGGLLLTRRRARRCNVNPQ